MTIVGPPDPADLLRGLAQEIPQYWQRLVARPGLTGLAQTRMGREETWAEKLAHDLEYIADRSVGLYLRVVVHGLAGDSSPPAGGGSRGGRH